MREYLVCFIGRPSTPMRSRLYRLRNISAGILVEQTGLNTSMGAAYGTIMRKSTFGFAPRGDAHFSYRLTELLATGTIPVVIDDHFMPPFGARNISSWAVLLPEANIEDAHLILAGISSAEICLMRR